LTELDEQNQKVKITEKFKSYPVIICLQYEATMFLRLENLGIDYFEVIKLVGKLFELH
jgi:hypothetical protein